MAGVLIACGVVSLVSAFLYFRFNDVRMRNVPKAVQALGPRWKDEEIFEALKQQQTAPVDIASKLPPRTGRRYIVVGGTGFLGGTLVLQLLARGEDPQNIRVLDLRLPAREELTTGLAAQVDYQECDITDENSVRKAFDVPWPEKTAEAELTVFHTAAIIRFYERIWALLSASAAVNVRGVQHVLDHARRVGATVFVHTSSGSVCIQRVRFWCWPWEKEVKYHYQHINDDDAASGIFPQKHEQFFSNYAYTKWLGECIVRAADRSSCGGSKDGTIIMRTGSLRPGNAIYGPGDLSVDAYLKKVVNPTFIEHIVSNWIHVENAAYAHLCYERRLIPSSDWKPEGAQLSDVGGLAFCISDAGSQPSYGDIYHSFTLLSNGRVTFPSLSPSFILFIGHLIELTHSARMLAALYLPYPLSLLHKLIPKPSPNVIILQPAIYALVMVHLDFDYSRAVRELDYKPFLTTLQGVMSVFDEHERKSKAGVESGERSGGMTVPKPILKVVAGTSEGGSQKDAVGTAALGAPHRVGSSGTATPVPERVNLDLDLQAMAKARKA